tara:strand:- start:3663 stop:3872 length:210 start_codon:yes stop_codon:yes gene_type:complete
MGAMKKIVSHAMEVLGLSLEEVFSMSLKEIDDALKNHESKLEDALVEYDVDVDENGPFLIMPIVSTKGE